MPMDASIRGKDAAIECKDAAIGSQESDVINPTPPEERLDPKRAEEKMAAGCDGETFVKRQKAAPQIVVAEEGTKTAGARRTKLVRVEQSYIDGLMRRPRPPYVGLSQERIDKFPDAALRVKLRAMQAMSVAMFKQHRERQDDIIEQYRTKGYAMQEVEVKEEEEEEEEAGIALAY